MQRRIALVLVLISAACFATLAVLTVLAYEAGGRPLPLLTWRFSITSALMAALLMWKRPRELISGLRSLHRYAALSLTGYGAASICFFFALGYAPASVVTVLLYTYPAIVSVVSALLFKEPLTPRRIAALVVTFAGCVLVVGVFDDRTNVALPGIVLGLGAAVGYSAFNVLSARMVGHSSRLVLMAYTFGLSALGVGAITLLVGEPLSPAGWSARLWLLLAAIIVVPTFAAVVLYLQGVRALGAPRAAIASTAEPVFTIVLAALVLGERLTVTQMSGALLVIAGIAVAEWPVARDADGIALI
ncbi:MAG: DMT family transporter [Coriobacteriia bacterium]|nr:DMT family transporter [Coriobacteriia bacterium]